MILIWIWFRSYRYSFTATIISLLGGVVLAFSLLFLFASVMNGLEKILVMVGGIVFFYLANRLAGKVASRTIRWKICSDANFAEKIAYDIPEFMDMCIELNPEFARRKDERDERERLQDCEVEKVKQEVLKMREARRLASVTDRKETAENDTKMAEKLREAAKRKYEFDDVGQ